MSKPSPGPSPGGCYDHPQYWDMAFRDETRREADFFEAAFQRFCRRPVRRVLEPGCGGGRLIVEMKARGYEMTGFDLNPAAVRYVRARLLRRRLAADVYVSDMTEFAVRQPFDAAFCTFNTFRHLTSERAAARHLKSVAGALRDGGIYILGFHLLPPDADPEAIERWTAKHGRTRVTTTLRVLSSDRRRRIEVVRFSLKIARAGKIKRLRSDFPLRMYTAAQFRRLLSRVEEFELLDVFDFWYEIEHPVPLDDELSDAVFILRKG